MRRLIVWSAVLAWLVTAAARPASFRPVPPNAAVDASMPPPPPTGAVVVASPPFFGQPTRNNEARTRALSFIMIRPPYRRRVS